MSDEKRNETVSRDKLPHEVQAWHYASHTDYVTLGMKSMTAKRMIGWLRDYAQFCEISGGTKTAERAWHVSNALANEVEPESIEPREFEPEDKND
jgi:hypothetical protein